MEKVFGGDQDAISYFHLIDISSSQTRKSIKQGILTPAQISIHELLRKTQETKL